MKSVAMSLPHPLCAVPLAPGVVAQNDNDDTDNGDNDNTGNMDNNDTGVGRNPAPVSHWLLPHPLTPSLILCARAGSVFGDGNHEVVQDFGNGTHPEHSSVIIRNIKRGKRGGDIASR